VEREARSKETATAATSEPGPEPGQPKFGNHEGSNISNAVGNPVLYRGDATDHDRMSTGLLKEDLLVQPSRYGRNVPGSSSF
jgi:hypothetical protein